MSDESRKRLTEFLGECWHECIWGELIDWHDGHKLASFSCSCGMDHCDIDHFDRNRTFLTWADLGAVKDALEKAGKWEAFEEWAWISWTNINIAERGQGVSTYIAWLFRPTVDGEAHFCQLAADFLKEEI